MTEIPAGALSRRESQIMSIIYRHHRATVEAIRSELPRPPSSSSVRKLLEILIAKGHLAREYDGPRYVYFPTARPEEVSRSALRQLVHTFFNNSPGSAMAALLDIAEEPLSRAEYERLSKLLDEAHEPSEDR